jgi:Rrf2 family protein
MNMTLSKRGDYVMRAAIFLAHSPTGAHRKVREVVADTEVPAAFASQILSDLVRAGLATSRAGRDGGYQLSRDPSTITALQIVEAAEGPLAAERCALGEGPCRWESVCPMHETWFAATQGVRELLAGTTLAELAERDSRIAAGTYAPADSHRRIPLQVQVIDTIHVERGAETVSQVLTSPELALGDIVARSVVEFNDSSTIALDTESGISSTPMTSQSGGVTKRTFQVVWRVRGAQHACHVEADLAVTSIDVNRCEITVNAIWHQDGGHLAAADVERLASRTIRAFLRELAIRIETTTTTPAQ